MTRRSIALATASAAAVFSAASGVFAVAAMDVGAAEPKKQIRIVPMGTTKGRDGRGPYRLDDIAHAQAVIDASMAMAGGTQISIDYDHQTVFAAVEGVGGTAPASGWITGLMAKADGIWAEIEWTPAAAQKIAGREYRYISPYFSFEKGTGRLTRILNAGLTNHPNFTELAAVAAADPRETDMDLKALAKALGLSEDATLEQITAAAAQLKIKADGAETAIAAASAAAGVVDPAKYVPMAAFAELREQVAAMSAKTLDETAVAAVDKAIAEGKITPAGRDHALSLYKSDATAFAAFVASSPVIVKAGADPAVAAAAAAAASGPLSAEERAVAKATGVTEEEFLKSKKQLAGVN